YPPLMPRMYADRGAELRAMFARVGEAGGATSLDLCEPDPDSDAGRVDWPAVLGQVLPFVDVFAPSIDELLFMFDRPAHERLQEAVALLSDSGRHRYDRCGRRDDRRSAGGAVAWRRPARGHHERNRGRRLQRG